MGGAGLRVSGEKDPIQRDPYKATSTNGRRTPTKGPLQRDHHKGDPYKGTLTKGPFQRREVTTRWIKDEPSSQMVGVVDISSTPTWIKICMNTSCGSFYFVCTSHAKSSQVKSDIREHTESTQGVPYVTYVHFGSHLGNPTK